MNERILNPHEVDFANLEDTVAPLPVVHFDQPNSDLDFSSFELGQVHALALPEFQGKSVARVAEHAFEEYAEFYVPGLRFRDWLVKNYSSVPESLRQSLRPLTRNKQTYHFFGSMISGLLGVYKVPAVSRYRSDWWLDARVFISEWTSSDRVVLIEPANSV